MHGAARRRWTGPWRRRWDTRDEREGYGRLNSAQWRGTARGNMIAEFEKLGEKEDFSQVVDGMMRQLLSKELMYEPMKQVCEKYPSGSPCRPRRSPKRTTSAVSVRRCFSLAVSVCIFFTSFFFWSFFFFLKPYMNSPSNSPQNAPSSSHLRRTSTSTSSGSWRCTRRSRTTSHVSWSSCRTCSSTASPRGDHQGARAGAGVQCGGCP